MNTLLPVASFVKSMEFLDNGRLGRQKSEACCILEVLTNEIISPGSILKSQFFVRKHYIWTYHPAVKMWRGHEEWLKLYIACALGEWEYRGFRNNIEVPNFDTNFQEPPRWLGVEAFHASHRSNLVRKMPLHYRKFWPEEKTDLPYFWPTEEKY